VRTREAAAISQAADPGSRSFSDRTRCRSRRAAEMLAEVVRNHVRQIPANVDIFRIQFTELPKLSGDRADTLRRCIRGYVRCMAKVIEAGQNESIFIDVPPCHTHC
jgi:Tetracyclin repressor-like, C-terminal domain